MTPRKSKRYRAALISLRSVSSQWTLAAMRELFEKVDDIELKKIEINFSGKTAEVLYDGKPLPEYDCIYAKGSYAYAPLLQSLTALREKSCYMPIDSRAFTIVHDKLLTQLTLQQHHIPMPRTYQAATVEAAKSIMKSMNFPIILKFPRGTGGKGVLFSESFASASSVLDALTALRQPFILQEYVETGGTDIRVVVVGDRVVAAMVRKARLGEKRANIHAGGVGEPIELDELTKKLAVKVAKVLTAEVCGVDILGSAKGPLVIEANISPGLQGITKTTKVDVARQIAEHLYRRTAALQERRKEAMTKSVLSEVSLGSGEALITTLDFRGARVLLPEVTVKRANLQEDVNYEIRAAPDVVTIKRFKMGG